MLSFFRRVSKSKIGTCDHRRCLHRHPRRLRRRPISPTSGPATSGFGHEQLDARQGRATRKSARREMSEAMQRRLQQVRQQKPDADYATHRRRLRCDRSSELIDERALLAFADKYRVPSVEAADRCRDCADSAGQGSERPVQRAGVSDVPRPAAADRCAGAARSSPAGLLQRLHADAGRDQCSDIGRNGNALRLDAARSARGRGGRASRSSRSRPGSSRPTRDLQQFYAANRSRYMIPEQRVLRYRARSGRSRSRTSPPRTRKSPPITTQTRRPTPPRRRAVSARWWSRTRRPPTAIAARPRAARRLPRPQRRRAPMRRSRSLTDQTRQAYARRSRATRSRPPSSPPRRGRRRAGSVRLRLGRGEGRRR